MDKRIEIIHRDLFKMKQQIQENTQNIKELGRLINRAYKKIDDKNDARVVRAYFEMVQDNSKKVAELQKQLSKDVNRP